MKLNITVLGSGSSGNAILFSLDGTGILIDAGFSRKDLFCRLGSCSVHPSAIKAILITHEHTDHVKGARVIADELDIPTYASTMTTRYLIEKNQIGRKKIAFETGSSFKILDFTVRTFKVQHDAIDPAGFIISAGSTKIGFAMDLGYIDPVTASRLKGCKVIMLESNHDTEMLKNSQRPLHLKRRIIGKAGHLSNTSAVNALHDLITNETSHLFLGHISGECNNIDLIRKMAQEKLAELNRTDIILSIMLQDSPFSLSMDA